MKTLTHKINIAKRENIENSISSLLIYAIKNNYSFSFWRLPNSRAINGILCFSNFYLNDDFKLEELPQGFILSPFDLRTSKINFSSADINFKIENSIEISSVDFDISEIISVIQNKTSESVFELLPNPINIRSLDYQKIVEDAVLEIEDGDFQKVVLARTILEKLKNDFNPISVFNLLSDKYPYAFVSINFHPDFGLWMGATPELLLETNSDGILKTVSIAGTKNYIPGSDIIQTEWRPKEIEEQALVSRYIVNQFKKIRVREFVENGPTVTLAGNLLHLKTDFSVNLNEINFSDLPTTMLKLLHPTPAVCGEPKNESLQFIFENENFNRELYAGFLGPINFSGSTNIYVNLRCMKIYNRFAQLFAGAGITKFSESESEFEETESKFNTLLSVLNLK